MSGAGIALVPDPALPGLALPGRGDGLGAVAAEAVLDAVARAFAVDRAELIGPCRKRPLVIARHAAAWLLWVRPVPGRRWRSLNDVGEIIRRGDHSTVRDGIAVLQQRAARDPVLHARLVALARDLPAPPPPRPPAQAEAGAEAGAEAALSPLEQMLAQRQVRRPVMELEADDSDARARAAGSLLLARAIAKARGVAA